MRQSGLVITGLAVVVLLLAAAFVQLPSTPTLRVTGGVTESLPTDEAPLAELLVVAAERTELPTEPDFPASSDLSPAVEESPVAESPLPTFRNIETSTPVPQNAGVASEVKSGQGVTVRVETRDAAQESPLYVPGELIVKFTGEARPNGASTGIASIDVLGAANGLKTANAAIASGIGEAAREAGLDRVYLLEFPQDANITSLAHQYSNLPGIEYAEPNYIMTTAFVPNDANFSNQWHLEKIGAQTAWNLSRGRREIIIAVIDTGVEWNHTDLAANIWNNTDEIPGNGLDDDNNSIPDDIRGFDFCGTSCTSNDTDPMDSAGHGTHVAGIVAAIGSNALGTTGLCPNCTIMALKVFDDNGTGAPNSAIASAINYAINNSANILSLSLGTTCNTFSSLLADAAIAARRAGRTIIVAAGNGNVNCRNTWSTPDVITITATAQDDRRTSFSHYGGWTPYAGTNTGAWVDMASPGLDILSTWIGNGIKNISGTSMSTPLVSGLAGLLLSANSSLTNDQIRMLLRSTTDNPIGEIPYYLGTGRINATRALQQAGKNPALAQLNHSQLDGKQFTGTIAINGTANGTSFTAYTMEACDATWPKPTYDASCQTIVTGSGQINNGNLANYTPTANGKYILRLSVNNTLGFQSIDHVLVSIQVNDYCRKITASTTLNDTVIGLNTTSNFNCFNITSNDVTIDCNGYSVAGIGGRGFYTEGRRNITLKNCQLEGFYYNTLLFNTNGSMLRDINSMASVGNSIRLENAFGNTLQNITAASTRDVSSSGAVLASVIILTNSRLNTLANITATHGLNGIFVGSASHNNTFQQLNASTRGARGSQYGIIVYGINNTVNRGEVYGNRYDGITIIGASNKFYNLNIHNNNQVKANWGAVTVDTTAIDSVLVNNTIYNNTWVTGTVYGALYVAAIANITYNNIWANDPVQLYSTAAANFTGNFWGRTEPPFIINGTDTNDPTVNDPSPYGQLNGWRNTAGAFDGATTSFESLGQANFTGLTGVVVENATAGKIEFTQAVRFTKDFPLESFIAISHNYTRLRSSAIALFSSELPLVNNSFNKTANITLYNVALTNPRVLVDRDDTGTFSLCTDCAILLSYGTTPKNITFSVTGFSTYALQETAITNATPSLTVTKTDAPDPVQAGSLLSYSIVVTNTGGLDAVNVSVVELYAAGVFYNSSTVNGTAGNTTFLLGNITGNTTVTLGINVTVNASLSNGTVLVNRVNVTFYNGSQTLNVSASTSTTVSADVTPAVGVLNVSASKTDGPDPVQAGGLLNYTITLFNNGTINVSNLTIVEFYAGGLLYNASSVAPSSGDSVFVLGNLSVNGSQVLRVTVGVNSSVGNGTVLVNRVNVSFYNGSHTLNLSASASTTVSAPVPLLVNASVVKSDSPDPVSAGSLLNYGVVVSNVGNVSLVNVTVVELYAAGVLFNSSTVNGTVGNTSFLLGSIARGGSSTLNVTVLVNSSLANGTVLVNRVNVSFSNGTETFNLSASTSTTVSANVTPAVGVLNVSASKTDSPEPVQAGGLLNYTVTVLNNGTINVSNLTIVEFYAGGLLYNASSVAPSSGDSVFVLGNLSVNGSQVLRVTVGVNSSIGNGTVLVNRVNVSFFNGSHTLNLSASASTTVNAPVPLLVNASVVKSDSPDPVQAGGLLNYGVVVSNVGNVTLLNVTVVESYAAGVLFNLSTVNGTAGNTTFLLGNVARGGSSSVNFTVGVNASLTNGTVLVNRVNVSFSNGTETFNVSASTSTTVNASVPAVLPNVMLVTPVNNSQVYNVSASFAYFVNHSTAIANCSLYINETRIETRQNITRNTNQNFNTTLTAGAHLWGVNCTDTSGVVGGSSRFNLSVLVNGTPPVQSNHNPANGTVVRALNFTLSFNLSIEGACRWSFSDDAYTAMVFACNGTTSPRCGLNLSEGNNTVYTACNSTAGDYDNTLTNTELSYLVDTIAPRYDTINVSALSINAGSTLYVWTNWSDARLSTATLLVDGAANATRNLSGTHNVSNFTYSVPSAMSGNHTFNIRANDSAGNTNTTNNITVFVGDGTPPTVNILSPASGLRTRNNITLQWNITEPSLENVWYYLDGNTTSTTDLTSVGRNGTVNVPVAESNKNITVAANDTGGNVGNATATFIIDRTPPAISIIRPLDNSNITSQTSRTLLNATFNETVRRSFFSTGLINRTLCLNCTSQTSNITLERFGRTTLAVHANDSTGNANNISTTFDVFRDTDGDGIRDEDETDADGDGINDTEDRLIGGLPNIGTNLPGLNLSINNSYNLSQLFNQTLPVKFQEGNDTVMEFQFNFNAQNLTLSNIVVEKYNSSNAGQLLIKGISLPPGTTKTVYVDRLSTSANFSSICIKDINITTIEEVTSGCNETSETLVNCPGTRGQYTCENYTNSQNASQWKVSGLNHSGIVQACTESWSCDDWSSCSGSSQSRTCTDDNSCGTTADKPATSQSCTSSGGGGGGGGGAVTLPVQPAPEPAPRTLNLAAPVTVRAGEVYNFYIDGTAHTMAVESITTTTVTLVFTSEPVRLTIAVGQLAELDLTGDNIPDLRVYLELIAGNTAALRITRITPAPIPSVPAPTIPAPVPAAPVPVTQPAVPEPALAPPEPEIPPPVPVKRAVPFAAWVASGAFAIVMAALILAYLIARRKHVPEQHMDEEAHVPKLATIIRNAVSQGHKLKTVRAELLKTNWPARLVDRAIREHQQKPR